MQVLTKRNSNSLLIMVHGFGSDYKGSNIFTYFSEWVNCDCYQYDGYSCGDRSDDEEHYNVLTLVKECESLVLEFSKSYKYIILCGHSLGGRVVMNIDHSLVDGIILINPAYGEYYKLPHFLLEQFDRINQELVDVGFSYYQKEEKSILINSNFIEQLAYHRVQSCNPPIMYCYGVLDERVEAKMVLPELNKLSNQLRVAAYDQGDHTILAKTGDITLVSDLTDKINTWFIKLGLC